MRAIPALFVCLSAAAPAFADIPLPPDRKYIDPRVRFEGVDKHADHVFVLHFRTGAGNPYAGPPRIIEVKNADVFNLNAQRRLVDLQLLALPRKEFEKKKEEDGSLKWLTPETAGVLKAKVDAPSTVVSAKVKEAPVTGYRVAIKDGKLTVENLPEEKKTSDAGSLPMVVAGLAASLSVALFGVWSFRRSGRK